MNFILLEVLCPDIAARFYVETDVDATFARIGRRISITICRITGIFDLSSMRLYKTDPIEEVLYDESLYNLGITNGSRIIADLGKGG